MKNVNIPARPAGGKRQNSILNKYREEIIPALMAKFGYSNVSAVPKVIKVTVNVGTGRIAKEAKILERVEKDIAKITGQKPSVRKAKKSISGFKVREGMPVGYAATLRGTRMYDFIQRLVSIALPRTRDFQGISLSSIDERGNLTIGIKEQTTFPEVTYDTLKDIFGLEVTITTSARTRDEGAELLRLMGFPLKMQNANIKMPARLASQREAGRKNDI